MSEGGEEYEDEDENENESRKWCSTVLYDLKKKKKKGYCRGCWEVD